MQHRLQLGLMVVAVAAAGCEDAEALFDAGLGPRPDGGGIRLDSGVIADAGAGAGDAGALDAGEIDAGPVGCGFDALAPADAPRIVLLSHPFADAEGTPGLEISSRTLASDGTFTEDGVRLDVGVRLSKLAFVPSGAFALALGERGELLSLRVGSVTDIEVVDQVMLPSGDYGELHVLPDGQTILAVGANGNPAAGISTVRLGCDGALEIYEPGFFALKLADSIAFTPDRSRVWVSGGQALFDPIDQDDVRVLQPLGGGGFIERGAFDVFTDFMSADRVALSPDGSTFLVPNGLDFSNEANQLAILAVEGDEVRTESRITEGLAGLAEVHFSADGETIFATLAEPGHVVALARRGANWAEADRVRGIGLADQALPLRRGALAETFFVPSTDEDSTSNIAMVRIASPGMLVDLGQHDLGAEITDIPRAIAIVP